VTPEWLTDHEATVTQRNDLRTSKHFERRKGAEYAGGRPAVINTVSLLHENKLMAV